MYLRSCSLAPNRLESCVHLLSSVSCDIPLSRALTFIVHARHDCLLYPFIALVFFGYFGFSERLVIVEVDEIGCSIVLASLVVFWAVSSKVSYFSTLEACV